MSRMQYPGAVYVISRGNERLDIFRDDPDRRAFLGILSESQAIYKLKL
jgi:hypothetical protein